MPPKPKKPYPVPSSSETQQAQEALSRWQDIQDGGPFDWTTIAWILRALEGDKRTEILDELIQGWFRSIDLYLQGLSNGPGWYVILSEYGVQATNNLAVIRSTILDLVHTAKGNTDRVVKFVSGVRIQWLYCVICGTAKGMSPRYIPFKYMPKKGIGLAYPESLWFDVADADVRLRLHDVLGTSPEYQRIAGICCLTWCIACSKRFNPNFDSDEVISLKETRECPICAKSNLIKVLPPNPSKADLRRLDLQLKGW